MGKLSMLKKNKRVTMLIVVCILLVVLTIGIFAADPFSVTITGIDPSRGYQVGDRVEISASLTNNTSETREGIVLKYQMPTDFVTLVDGSVKIGLDSGVGTPAAKGSSYSSVYRSRDYKYLLENSGRFTVSAGDLPAGSTVTITYTIEIISTNPKNFKHVFYGNNNMQTILKAEPGSVSISITATVDPDGNKTSKNLTSPGAQARVGDVIEYVIEAKNNTGRQGSLWKNVTVTDTLDEYVTFVDDSVVINAPSGNVSEYGYNDATKTLTFNVGDLGPLDTATITFHVTVNEGSYGKTIKNAATVSGIDDKEEEEEDKEKTIDVDDGEGQKVSDAYKITFNKNAVDATGTMEPQYIVVETSAALNANTFSRDGYIFLGWSTSAISTEVVYEDEAEVTPDKDMELFAVWAYGTYTINFNKGAPGASGEMEPQLMQAFTSTALKANEFVYTGYKFAGWSEDPSATEATYADEQEITPEGDMTLYAIWEIDNIVITFDKNDDNAVGSMEDQTARRNIQTRLNLNTYTRVGNGFLGWSTDKMATSPEYIDGSYIIPADNMTLYAIWSKDIYTITFNKVVPEATGEMDPQEIEHGGSIELSENKFMYTGHKFLGWSTDPSSGEVIYTDKETITPTKSLILFAIWSEDVCTITYNKNSDNATGEMEQQEAIRYNNVKLSANEFQLAGHTFKGWSTGSGDTEPEYGVGETIVLTEDMTLYAIWSRDTYTINFVKGAAEAKGQMDSISVLAGESIALSANTFTYEGYKFIGWGMAPGSDEIAYTDEQTITPTSSMTLYAQWSTDACEIIFDKNASDATGEMDPQIVVRNKNSVLNPNTFVRVGYTFDGWSTDPNASTAEYGNRGNFVPTETTTTLYAVWTRDVYSIVFNKVAPDATGEMETQYVTSGESSSLNENLFERPGYVFVGWSTVLGSSTVEYTDKQIVTPTQNMTLYVVWSLDTCTITFDKDAADATGSMNPQSIVRNTATELKANEFSRPNYTFVGWSTTSGTTSAEYDNRGRITPAGDMTLYAVWAKQSYTISFNKGAINATGEMNPLTVEAGSSIELSANAFERSGYSFLGWSTSAYSTTVVYEDRDVITPTGNMTLYAVWNHDSCIITFDKNADDAVGEMEQQEVKINEPTTLNSNKFTREGYYFRGWSTTSNGTVEYDNMRSITISDNITLYAIWGTDPCTITFYKGAPEATGTMEPLVAPANKPVALTANDFEYNGYFFMGWSTEPYADEVEYGNRETIVPVDDMFLYAVWQLIVFPEEHIAYVNGYTDGTVRAEDRITRAEAISIFYRLLDEKAFNDKDKQVVSSFNDVSTDKWYHQAINYMADKGLINGYPDGSYKPNQHVTRAEFAKMAARYDSLSFPDGNKFIDVPSTHWAVMYINSAAEKGWVSGYADGTFRPGEKIKRAEVVSIVNSMLVRHIDEVALERDGINPYSDLKDDYWAYADVMEASIEHEYDWVNGKEIWK